MAKHPDVMEQAVVGIDDEIKGLIPIGLVVLKKGRCIYYTHCIYIEWLFWIYLQRYDL